MALFMDIHTLPDGATAAEVAGAHQEDLKVQGQYGVDYKSYWVDEANGKIFCLVDAPDAESAIKVHQEAHGLLADSIHPVVEGA